MPTCFPIFIDYFTRALDRHHEILSQEKTAYVVDFSSDFSEEVGIRENLHVSRGGLGNGLLLKSLTGFAGSPKAGNHCLLLPAGHPSHFRYSCGGGRHGNGAARIPDQRGL